MVAKATIALVALGASVVAAQGTTANSTIDPNSITPTMRSQWCASEINTCGSLCNGVYLNNTCDSDTLAWNCTCNNGSTPGLQYYTGSMDTFICEQIYANCIAAGVGDQAAQAVCTNNRNANCGTLDANNVSFPSTTSSSSSASATAASATSSAASSSTSKAAAATMMALGREYGSGVVAVGVAAAFGLLL